MHFIKRKRASVGPLTHDSHHCLLFCVFLLLFFVSEKINLVINIFQNLFVPEMFAFILTVCFWLLTLLLTVFSLLLSWHDNLL